MYGRILNIDLTNRSYHIEDLEASIIKKFIGGKGLGAYLLHTNLQGGEDSLAPENPLIFINGPFTGTMFPTSGRTVVVSKSPLTGIFTDSHAGGYFGPELKKAGYDGIIIKGSSITPTYIWINNDSIQFKNASHIWGSTVENTIDSLREITDAKAHVACIGPAGENLVKVSSIMMDKDDDSFRAGIAARAGVGAVMGSKNLKAIVVKGSRENQLYDLDKFKGTAVEAFQHIKSDSFIPTRKKYGTSYWVEPANQYGVLPTNNFQQGHIENGDKLYANHIKENHVERNTTCYSCPIQCGKIIKAKGKNVKVEYETIALLGSNNGMTDIREVSEANLLCNNLGLDTISVGNIIGFAMECMEKGILPSTTKFGDSEGQLDLINKIAYKEGIGKVLSEGVKIASQSLGGDAESFAMHVKGLEIPGYEPRSSWGMALAYATADRGGCHQRAWTVAAELRGALERFSFNDNIDVVKGIQDERASAYSLLLCDFAPVKIEHVLKGFNYATGIELSEEEYLQAGERIWNLIRLFNVREGISRKDDTLPPRVFDDELPLPEKNLPMKSIRLDRKAFSNAIDEYYRIRGWDANGIPTKEKLKELDLNNFGYNIEYYVDEFVIHK
ncbi:aldehyde:ferredoxin oxidoreductase [Anaerovirgula multivorans]|uniref:Aldehyde:ferredoxin oxidoreductase n=1 Tax=Anaerovirgula multivorans TaxID=312168 RepID=A0A239KT01_9FIRM|nr:aldehyde ferredoxin oxidoreductase family protein [Anaerovirgula multivorans]SNT21321.1 aldehyde:ferredoxin oxidoreductase [Anaerovirgula multivorans]